MQNPYLLGWVNKSDAVIVQSDTKDGLILGVEEMGFIFCGQHPLLVTRTQVSDPGPIGLALLLLLLCHGSFKVTTDTCATF